MARFTMTRNLQLIVLALFADGGKLAKVAEIAGEHDPLNGLECALAFCDAEVDSGRWTSKGERRLAQRIESARVSQGR